MALERAGRREPLFVADTYKGIPVDPIMASVIRDQEREQARKRAGLTQQDVWQQTERAFEPGVVKVNGAPGAVSAEAKGRLDAIRGAGSLAEAIRLASEMPEVAAMAKANKNGFPIFQRVKELQSWQMAGAMVASGHVRHYANNVRLMAYANAPDLRLQVLRHFAGNADYGSVWVHKSEWGYDRSYNDAWYAFRSAGTSKVQEFFPSLTPAVLADYLEKTIATGEPPIERS